MRKKKNSPNALRLLLKVADQDILVQHAPTVGGTLWERDFIPPRPNLNQWIICQLNSSFLQKKKPFFFVGCFWKALVVIGVWLILVKKVHFAGLPPLLRYCRWYAFLFCFFFCRAGRVSQFTIFCFFSFFFVKVKWHSSSGQLKYFDQVNSWRAFWHGQSLWCLASTLRDSS